MAKFQDQIMYDSKLQIYLKINFITLSDTHHDPTTFKVDGTVSKYRKLNISIIKYDLSIN